MATPNAPCGCLQIRGYGVANLLQKSRGLLGQFIDTKRFDIFYQSPWVSGQHMVENLARASDLGAQAWHHAYYVGTTLHIYHTLLALQVIKHTDFPLMESLCSRFEGMVFLGHRPSRNLLSCYQRWSGGCLSFPKGRCNGMHTHNHSNGMGKKWSMKYVKDASQGGDHPKRGFEPMKISLFSLLSSRNFALDDDVLAWVHCCKPWQKASGIIWIWLYICRIDHSYRPARKTFKNIIANQTQVLSLHDPWKPFKKKFSKNSKATFRSPRLINSQSTSCAWRS